MTITIKVFSALIFFPMVLLNQPQRNTSNMNQALYVPIEAFGTFEGTQKSYIMHVNGIDVPVGESHWRLVININEIELIQFVAGDSYHYSGEYKVLKMEGTTSG